MTSARFFGTAALTGAFIVGSLGSAAVAAADNTVPPSMLNTTCTLDQIMAATKVVDPITYGELVGKYITEPRWVQGGIVYHMNLLLAKPPQPLSRKLLQQTVAPDRRPGQTMKAAECVTAQGHRETVVVVADDN